MFEVRERRNGEQQTGLITARKQYDLGKPFHKGQSGNPGGRHKNHRRGAGTRPAAYDRGNRNAGVDND
jgi:hypothetical protein